MKCFYDREGWRGDSDTDVFIQGCASADEVASWRPFGTIA